MSGFRLHTSSAIYTIEDIRSQTDHENDAFTSIILEFCKDWLDGKEWFELKTSGSTGTPKILSIHRSQIEASAKASLDFFQLQPSDTVVCPLSMQVIGGQMMVYRSLIGGLELHVLPADKSVSQLNTSVTYDFMPVSALQLYELLQHHPDKRPVLNGIKNILVGGSSVSEALLIQINKYLHTNVWQSYGMTETVSHIAMRRIHPVKEEYYTLLPDIEIAVDARSCLKIKGAVTQQLWLQTNDVAELKNENQFTFIGRADFTINSGGIKIQVEPIEKIIETLFHEWQIDTAFFVAGIPDDSLGEKMILVLENPLLCNEEQTKILNELTKRLPKYHSPKAIQTAAFCYTASGKINRRETLAQK